MSLSYLASGFLLPTRITPSGEPAAALAEVGPWLAAKEVDTLVVVTSTWRTPSFVAADSLPGGLAGWPIDHELAAATRAEGAAMGLAMGRGPADGSLLSCVSLLDGLSGHALLPLSLALASPERITDLGFAVHGAASALGRNPAILAFGHLSRGEGPTADAFDREVLALLGDGLGGRLLDMAPDLWLGGRPDADLAHLIALLGAVGGDTPGQCLAYSRTEGLGSAVVRFEQQPDEPFAEIPERQSSVIWLRAQPTLEDIVPPMHTPNGGTSSHGIS